MRGFYAEHARELAGVGTEYHMASWQHKEATKKKPGRLVVTLMTAPLLESGEIAWKYADRDGKKVVDLGMDEHDAWILEWERSTGKCSQCSATNPGQEWIGWSKDAGDKFQRCARCHGTNAAPHLAQATA